MTSRRPPRRLSDRLRQRDRVRLRSVLTGARPGKIPYWAVLPSSLLRAYGGKEALHEHRDFLADAVWAQYCLFKCVRLQDDLYDGHDHDLSKVFVADHFLIEGARSLSKHFGSAGAFWEAFYGALDKTTRAILDADRLQTRPGGDPHDLLVAYARVDSIFTVGAAAVCIKFRRRADLAALSALVRTVGVASQILDDLEDFTDDLRRERFNYAAKVLLDGRKPASIGKAMQLIGREVALGDGPSHLFAEARRYFDRSAVISSRLGCTEITERLKASQAKVDRAMVRFHRTQVRNAFAPILHT